jgi:hypothetical protein
MTTPAAKARIDEQARMAEAAMRRGKWFEAERCAHKGLEMARRAEEFALMAEICLTLQEARRQRLQEAFDAKKVFILNEGIVEEMKLQPGCYIVEPPLVGADARRPRCRGSPTRSRSSGTSRSRRSTRDTTSTSRSTTCWPRWTRTPITKACTRRSPNCVRTPRRDSRGPSTASIPSRKSSSTTTRASDRERGSEVVIDHLATQPLCRVILPSQRLLIWKKGLFH